MHGEIRGFDVKVWYLSRHPGFCEPNNRAIPDLTLEGNPRSHKVHWTGLASRILGSGGRSAQRLNLTENAGSLSSLVFLQNKQKAASLAWSSQHSGHTRRHHRKSSVSALRSLSEITSALCYQHHSTHCISPTAITAPLMMQLPSPCTLLFPILTRGTHVRMLFVDYRSAFNTIVPSKLVVKLRTLGPNNSLCSWILDNLTGRRQVVRLGSNISSLLTLNTGSPKGCVLSLLLYSLYTHDSPRQPRTAPICGWHNGGRSDHRRRWISLQRRGAHPD